MTSPTTPAGSIAKRVASWCPRARAVPKLLWIAGGLAALLGASVPSLRAQFAYSWLLAFMFYLSLGLGALFLVLMHHLFDAGWSTPLRRFLEHLAALLFPWMALLFLPVAWLAKPYIYPWMRDVLQANPDHALRAKYPLFTLPMFYIMSAVCFLVWWLLTDRLRYWSLTQDRTGAARCTFKMRFHSAWGIFAFALTLTLGAILWMKALMHGWFSTMYGVYYFAGSVWLTLATVYFITVALNCAGFLSGVLRDQQFYFLGSLLLAFTVFYAYIHFSQYFIIWNANMPEETFWYIVRENGSWWDLGLIIIFGHFFIPFLALLRIDAKLSLAVMIPVCAWAWAMHFCDLSFNIMPSLHPDGFVLHWLDVACMAFMGGLLTWRFLWTLQRHPPYPLRDPRLIEAMGHAPPVPCQISGGERDGINGFLDGSPDSNQGGVK